MAYVELAQLAGFLFHESLQDVGEIADHGVEELVDTVDGSSTGKQSRTKPHGWVRTDNICTN